MNNVPTVSPAGVAPGRGRRPEGLRVIGLDDLTESDDDLVVPSSHPVGDNDPELVSERPGPSPLELHQAIDDPHRLAREVLTRYTHPEGSTLAYHRGQFYVYEGTAYRPHPEFRDVTLVQWVKEAVDRIFVDDHKNRRLVDSGEIHRGRNDTPFRPKVVPKITKRLLGDVAQAIISMVSIVGSADAPFWRSPTYGDPDPINVMPAENGLVNLGADQPKLTAHTARFFSAHVLPYPYDPDAPRPERWLQFLAEQWGNDPESIDALHEVIGYLLTPDTRFHKMFLMIGPPRSGRSTIKEVITGLIGEPHVAACSPVSLGSPFGLEPLLGKSVAIMADARTGGDMAVMLDRLLRIVGGDPVEVNCKNRPMLPNVRMRTRFVLVSNELPDFRDASRAITSRYHILRTTKTVPPEQRDPDLLDKLMDELPGILNLAIDGRKRLHQRGQFIQPASGVDLIEQAEDIASPVAECVKDEFAIGPNFVVSKAKAFEVWARWAEEHGQKAGTSATFGKHLSAAFPTLRSSRPRAGEKQVSSYVGMKLRDGSPNPP